MQVTVSCPSGTGWTAQADLEMRHDIDQLAAGRGVLWARTTSSCVFARLGIDTDHPLGTSWQEVPGVLACNVDIGPKDTAWCVDEDGVAHFMRGVKRSCPVGDGNWWQISLGQQVGGKDSSILGSLMEDMSTSISTLWSKGGSARRADSLKFVAASEAGVCGVTNSSYCHLSSGPLIGNLFRPSGVFGTVVPFQAVSLGAATGDNGVVWLARPNGEMFYMESNHLPVSVPPPDFPLGCHLAKITASSLHVAVWALDTAGNLYERSGLSQYCRQGLGWQSVSMQGMRGGKVQSISCGGYTAFVTDVKGDAWFRYTCDLGSKGRDMWYLVNHPPGEKLAQVCLSLMYQVPDHWHVSPMSHSSAHSHIYTHVCKEILSFL